jgi:small subunit ribosomal protein S16
MATKIRLARGGAKKRPFYRIVVADVRAPRDGDYIEKLGIYNPLAAKDSGERFKYDAERMKYWISTGAEPSETIERFLRADGVITTKPGYTPKPKSEKLPARAQARKDAAEEAKNNPPAAEPEVVAEAPAEETAAEEAPAQ